MKCDKKERPNSSIAEKVFAIEECNLKLSG